MEIKTFFFDTYAFYEIIGGNINYKPFLNDIAIVTTKLNLMELYYGLLIKYNQQITEKYYNKLVQYTINIDDNTIKNAMLFKSINKKKRLSYIDCIGYIIALQRNIKFLTGDKEFENLPNIEYVK